MIRNALLGICAGVVGLAACAKDTKELPPRGERTRSSASLQNYASCGDLEAGLRTSFAEEMRVRLLNLDDEVVAYASAAESDTAGTAAPSTGGETRQEGVDFSGTNNQEGGVDEADFVKTDGYSIFVLNGATLQVLDVPEFGKLSKLGELEIEGAPTQMLEADDKLVVFSAINPWTIPASHPLAAVVGQPNGYGWWYSFENLTKLTVVDVSDRSNPTVARQLYLEGTYQTARKVGGSVRMASYVWMNIPGLKYWPELPNEYYALYLDDPQRQVLWHNAIAAAIAENDALIASIELEDLVPQIYEQFADDTFVEHPFTDSACSGFAAAADGYAHGITSLLSLDLLSETFAFEADHIVTNASTVYASQDTLVLAEPANDWWWYWDNDGFDDATNIHRFDISEPGKTVYSGSGRLDGTIIDQFSLSEYNGNIRVAATTGRFNWWWLPSEEQTVSSNHVFVLAGDSELEVVGHVGGIAPGERIWTSRFVADEGYLVTFQNIDPLWTIDLSDPTNPQVKGELEVPGVSTYIHPLANDHLLTIGYGGDENGLDWQTQISLFDVTDFSNPTLDDTQGLAPPSSADGWSSAWSEASYEHKAFQYWEPKEMLAIPLSTYRWSTDNCSNAESGYDYGYGCYEYFSKLQLVSVDIDGGLSLYGDIDHSAFFNSDPNQLWSYRDVRRSIFMGDYIYAISDRGVTAHKLDDLSLSASVELPGNDGSYYWYY